MNLLEIRKQVVKISGRYDLVSSSTAFTDNGIDHFIQQGQRSLERRLGIDSSVGKFYDDTMIGDYKVKFQNCRAIQEVWIMDSDSRTELEKLGEYDLRAIHQRFLDNMYTTPLSTMERGRPLYYFPTSLRRVPESETGSGDSTTLSSYLETVTPNDPSYSGFIMFPPCDKSYGVEVKGLFYHNALMGNTDSNIWSVNYPNLLVMASMQQLDTMYRGGKTARDWDALIEGELMNIEKDQIEQEINSIDTLRG